MRESLLSLGLQADLSAFDDQHLVLSGDLQEGEDLLKDLHALPRTQERGKNQGQRILIDLDHNRGDLGAHAIAEGLILGAQHGL